ncbi:hypothetical protein ACIQD3_23535 [Peribacillus loiseleuriae]
MKEKNLQPLRISGKHRIKKGGFYRIFLFSNDPPSPIQTGDHPLTSAKNL